MVVSASWLLNENLSQTGNTQQKRLTVIVALLCSWLPFFVGVPEVLGVPYPASTSKPPGIRGVSTPQPDYRTGQLGLVQRHPALCYCVRIFSFPACFGMSYRMIGVQPASKHPGIFFSLCVKPCLHKYQQKGKCSLGPRCSFGAGTPFLLMRPAHRAL